LFKFVWAFWPPDLWVLYQIFEEKSSKIGHENAQKGVLIKTSRGFVDLVGFWTCLASTLLADYLEHSLVRERFPLM